MQKYITILCLLLLVTSCSSQFTEETAKALITETFKIPLQEHTQLLKKYEYNTNYWNKGNYLQNKEYLQYLEDKGYIYIRRETISNSVINYYVTLSEWGERTLLEQAEDHYKMLSADIFWGGVRKITSYKDYPNYVEVKYYLKRVHQTEYNPYFLADTIEMYQVFIKPEGGEWKPKGTHSIPKVTLDDTYR